MEIRPKFNRVTMPGGKPYRNITLAPGTHNPIKFSDFKTVMSHTCSIFHEANIFQIAAVLF